MLFLDFLAGKLTVFQIHIEGTPGTKLCKL